MISLFIAILPALFMWEFAAIKVNFRLPKDARTRLFRLGSWFAVLALVIELLEGRIPLKILSPGWHAFVQALFIAAIPEELVKFAAVNKFGRRERDELGPGVAILLAVGASLGFAVLETKLYVLHGGLGVWAVRAVSAIPMHGIFGFVMGSFMVLAGRDPLRFDKRMLVLAVVVPIIFHFAYDFPLLLHDFDKTLVWPQRLQPVIMLLEGVFALILTNHAVNGDMAIYDRTQPADPRGRRARGFACVTLLLLLLFLGLGQAFHHGAPCAVLAAMPLMLTLDLGLLAYVRSHSSY
jgi:RsiW-degrading membrane proteinase PrsW (M82 family)